MQYVLFVAFAALIQVASSQVQNAATTVIVTVTVPRSSSQTPAAIAPQAEPTEAREANDHLMSSSTTSLVTTSASEPSQNRFSPATSETTSSQTLPEVTPAATNEPELSEPGASSLGAGQVDTAGGASGSSAAAFHLSQGGLAAILIVVILVGLFGAASILLFIIAKRRQWTMRQTLSRASRRLTGRFGKPKTPTAADRRSRRTGIRLESPPRPGIKAVYPPGHKRGLVVDVKDPEKGPQPLDGKAPKNTRPRENTWAKRIWGDGWK